LRDQRGPRQQSSWWT